MASFVDPDEAQKAILEEAAKLEALEVFAKEGENRTAFSPSWFSNLMTNLNLVFAFGFDSLLFYTIDPRLPTPETAGFLIKIVLLIVSYFVINIVLGVFVYSALIPAYYTFYTAKFANFAAYLKKQQTRYQNDSNRRILVREGDPKTIGTLAFYPTVIDLSGGTIQTMDDYNKYVGNLATPAAPVFPADPTKMTDAQKSLQKFYAKYPTPDSATIGSIIGHFQSLPDQFKRYVIGQQQYLYQAIQFWVIMLLAILFVIPIKYTLVNVVTPPKLPTAADIPGMTTLGKMGSMVGATAAKMGSKVMERGSAAAAATTTPPATTAATPSATTTPTGRSDEAGGGPA